MSYYNRDFFDGELATSLRSAEVMVPIVLSLIKPKSIADVGCGVGAWLSTFRLRGINDILGIEGKWIDKSKLQIPEDKLLEHDLTKPLSLKQKFDLVVSLEVGEHLPPRAARTFVRNIVSLGDVVLFSAAVPYQGGTDHINEQWPDYWKALFEEHDYVVVDCIRQHVWDNSKIDWWYSQNTLIYVKKSKLKDYPALENEYNNQNPRMLNVVHPMLFIKNSDPKTMHPKRVLKALPYAFRRGMGHIGSKIKK